MYYPTHIADDESSASSHDSNEIEGSTYLPLHLDRSSSVPEKRRQHPWEKNEEYGLAVSEDFDDAAGRQSKPSAVAPLSKSVGSDSMAELIQNERNRRLGVSVASYEIKDEEVASTATPERAPSGLLGNIKGWFAGGNSNQHSEKSLSNSSKSCNNETPINTSRRDSIQQPIHEDEPTNFDDKSTVSSSDSSDSSISASSLDHRTRARHRALRYLSNSCVDAGRRSKTMSYIWGLERLDLKRRRDRYERELGVVEGEMNKDWGKNDKVARLAGQLVRELPRLMLSGADAGAGSDVQGSSESNKAYMTLNEYVDSIQAFDSGVDWEESSHPSQLLWRDAEAVERYNASLQNRLREAMERTKSLEKRLAVLEKTGDEIVGSLCEDLVDVTSHSNKAEARYVKKGKALERRRRRLERSYQCKVKDLEKRVNLLEEGILTRSSSGISSFLGGDSDTDSDDEENEEDDEIRLEKKLSDIKAKIEMEKAEHEISVQSIRRQCEQSKLKLSVARLVMAGDDNLREYISALERFDLTKQHRMKRRASLELMEEEEIPPEALPPPPPAKVTRGRAKLLKAMHLERIYEHRLAVSKAFNDAAINALEQELADRETAGQKMEVRCLNELMVIDSEIKEIVSKGDKELETLQKEVRDLKEAMVSVSSHDSIILADDEAAAMEHIANFAFPALESAMSTDNDSSSTGSNQDTGTSDCVDKSGRSEDTFGDGIDHSALKKVISHGSAQIETNLSSTKIDEEPGIVRRDSEQCSDDIVTNGSSQIESGEPPTKIAQDSEKLEDDSNHNDYDEESHLGDINVNTPLKNNKLDNSVQIHSQSNQSKLPEGEPDHDQHVKTVNDTAELNGSHEGKDELLDESSAKSNSDQSAAIARGTPDAALPDALSSNDKHLESTNNSTKPSDVHKRKVLQTLGQELKCTLAEYQTSLGISSSSDRIEQLDYMNQVVSKIAEVSGIDLNQSKVDGGIKSWSHSLIESELNTKEKKEKKRSKKRRSKIKRRKSRKKSEPDDGLTEQDRLFIASLSSARFNDSCLS